MSDTIDNIPLLELSDDDFESVSLGLIHRFEKRLIQSCHFIYLQDISNGNIALLKSSETPVTIYAFCEWLDSIMERQWLGRN